jgi:hypothetical protein
MLSACASQPPRGEATPVERERSFLDLDVDRDAALTRREARAFPLLRQRFERADANSDGLLDRDEYNSRRWRQDST